MLMRSCSEVKPKTAEAPQGGISTQTGVPPDTSFYEASALQKSHWLEISSDILSLSFVFPYIELSQVYLTGIV